LKNKGRDYSQLLIVAALLVTLPRFAGAFIAAVPTKSSHRAGGAKTGGKNAGPEVRDAAL
jgi:hypothetical protein